MNDEQVDKWLKDNAGLMKDLARLEEFEKLQADKSKLVAKVAELAKSNATLRLRENDLEAENAKLRELLEDLADDAGYNGDKPLPHLCRTTIIRDGQPGCFACDIWARVRMELRRGTRK